MNFGGFLLCYIFGVVLFSLILSYFSRRWVGRKWYLIAWFPWTATMLGIVVWWIFHFLSVWGKPGMDGAVDGIVALFQLIFAIPALCAFIIALINSPLRTKREQGKVEEPSNGEEGKDFDEIVNRAMWGNWGSRKK